MGRKKRKDDDEEFGLPLSDDFPPLPPDPPPGGWKLEPLAKVENIHDPPPGGTGPPMYPDPIDIRRFDLRVAKIQWAMAHPNNPESLVLTYVDVGEKFPRPIISEIGRDYKKEDLEGRKVVALCNIEPLTMKNIGNTAMLMCASAPDTEGGGFMRHDLWVPPPKAKVGEEINCEEYPIMAELLSPELPFMHNDEKIFDQIAADMRVNSLKQVVYKDKRLFVRKKLEAGFITTTNLADCAIKLKPV